MEYIVIPVELYNSIPDDQKKYYGIQYPRYSNDGLEVIMHLNIYEEIFPSVSPLSELEENDKVEHQFPVYTNPSDEFTNLMDSSKWKSEEI